MNEKSNEPLNEQKKVKVFFNNFKYEGFLIAEDDTTYTINDYKEGIIKLPKANSILKIIQNGNK